MAESNGSSVALLVLALLCGGVGFLAGRAANASVPRTPPPTLVTTAAAPLSETAIQYVPQTGMLYVVKDAQIYRIDAKTLNVLDGNYLSWQSVPFNFRKAREAESRQAAQDDLWHAEREQRERAAERAKWTSPTPSRP